MSSRWESTQRVAEKEEQLKEMMSSHRHLLHQLDFNATINPYINQLSGAKLTSAHKDRNNKINMCWSSDSDCQCTRLCFFQGGGGCVETLTYFHHNGWWGEAVCVCVCVCVCSGMASALFKGAGIKRRQQYAQLLIVCSWHATEGVRSIVWL